MIESKNKAYNELLDELISRLVFRKDNFSEEIFEIATYIDLLEYDVALTDTDIKQMNNLRYKMEMTYKLIEDLEKLRK